MIRNARYGHTNLNRARLACPFVVLPAGLRLCSGAPRAKLHWSGARSRHWRKGCHQFKASISVSPAQSRRSTLEIYSYSVLPIHSARSQSEPASRTSPSSCPTYSQPSARYSTLAPPQSATSSRFNSCRCTGPWCYTRDPECNINRAPSWSYQPATTWCRTMVAQAACFRLWGTHPLVQPAARRAC